MNIKTPLSIKLKKKSKEYWIFLFFNFLAFISAYFYNIRAGVLACIIIIIYYLLDSRYRLVLFDYVFITYFSLNLFSGIGYIFNGRPIILYLVSISYNIIPMLLYGLGFVTKEKEGINPVYSGLLISNFLLVSIGLIVYFIPSLAARVGRDSILTAGIDAYGIGYRFDSYLDSLTMGSLLAINIPIIMLNNTIKNFTKLVMLSFTACGLLLTMQRGAWVVGIVGILGSMYISVVFGKKGNFKRLFGYIVIIVILVFVILYFANNFISSSLMDHLNIRLKTFSFNSMMRDRNYQVDKGLNTFYSYPLGFGVGSAGIKAATYGMQIVPDGNLLKILVETGIFGFIFFCILNIRGLVRGFKAKKYYSCLIVALFLCHSIGSNVLDFYYSSFVYWFALGYLSCPRLQEK